MLRVRPPANRSARVRAEQSSDAAFDTAAFHRGRDFCRRKSFFCFGARAQNQFAARICANHTLYLEPVKLSDTLYAIRGPSARMRAGNRENPARPATKETEES